MNKNLQILFLLLFFIFVPSTQFPTPAGSISAEEDDDSGDQSREDDHNGTSSRRHFQLIIFDWEEVEAAYTIAAWLMLAGVAKILFHANKHLAEALPDSALLIVLGFGLGLVLRILHVDHRIYMFNSHTFFLYLLPPIIFDAGFFMPNRQLFENFDSVLLFAFVGTIWNTMAIGFSLDWMAKAGLFSVPFSTIQILLFASLISSVDPVAVICIFEEIHVNEFLFINVFGEALFNDGAAVVLYQMFRKFDIIGAQNLDAMDFIEGLLSFFIIALGGVLVGLFFAMIACIATKCSSQVRILAPMFVFVVPYMSYLTAEMFGISSILAIIASAIAMKHYVKGNLSHDAYNSAKYFTKMLAQCAETVIFLFLGVSTVSRSHKWDWCFVASTIAFCLLFRIIGVVVQCAVLNRFRKKKFSLTDQFVLSYGGLRGAIAFGLVISLHQSNHFPARQMFVSTTLAVIFFTVFVQGISIRPLLNWLKVEKLATLDLEGTMGGKIFERYNDYTMSGLEAILGHKGSNTFRDAFERFNANVLKPWLMRGEKRKKFDASAIVRAYHKITLQEALQIAQSGNKITKKAAKFERLRSVTTSLPQITLLRSVSKVGDKKNQMLDIDQFLSNRENVELLYVMFSRMLDRKIDEMKAVRRVSDLEDDIKDDYMGIIGRNQTNDLEDIRRLNTRSRFMLRRRSSLPNSLCSRHTLASTVEQQELEGNATTVASFATKNGLLAVPQPKLRRKFSLPLSPNRGQIYKRNSTVSFRQEGETKRRGSENSVEQTDRENDQ